MNDRLFCTDNAVENIINKYSGTVYKLAFAQTGNKNDAENIFQEVFLRYIKKNPVFENKEHEKTWFIRAAIHCYKNLWNSPFNRNVQPLEDNIGTDNKSEENLSEKNMAEEYLLLLPQKYRIVLHLVYCENMSTVQISKILKRKESTVRMQITRAGRLREEYMEGDNFHFYKYYRFINSQIEPGEELLRKTKEKMHFELERKRPSLSILKYRFGIISAYLVFIFLAVLVVQIQDPGVFVKNGISKETAAGLPESGKYIKKGYEYKKGDVIKLKITFPQEYVGKEIKIVCKDSISGKSIEVYEGKSLEVIYETFNVDEDGKADFLVLTGSGENNIADLVDIYYVIKRSAGKEENMIPVK